MDPKTFSGFLRRHGLDQIPDEARFSNDNEGRFSNDNEALYNEALSSNDNEAQIWVGQSSLMPQMQLNMTPPLYPSSFGVGPTYNPPLRHSGLGVGPTYNPPLRPSGLGVGPTHNPPLRPSGFGVGPTHNPPLRPSGFGVGPTYDPPLRPSSFGVGPTYNLPLSPSNFGVGPSYPPLHLPPGPTVRLCRPAAPFRPVTPAGNSPSFPCFTGRNAFQRPEFNGDVDNLSISQMKKMIIFLQMKDILNNLRLKKLEEKVTRLMKKVGMEDSDGRDGAAQ